MNTYEALIIARARLKGHAEGDQRSAAEIHGIVRDSIERGDSATAIQNQGLRARVYRSAREHTDARLALVAITHSYYRR